MERPEWATISLNFFFSRRMSLRLSQKMHSWLKSFLNSCVEVDTYPRISQSDFPVMHFVAL